MKTLAKVLAVAMVASLLIVGNAMALPTLLTGYQWANNQTWTLTDLTSGLSGSADFEIKFESADYESNFGLYIGNGDSLAERFRIFTQAKEPGADQSVYFKQDAGNWLVSTDYSTWKIFDNEFGFYFGVNSDSDPAVDYFLYSQNSLNPDQQLHVAAQWNGIDRVQLNLEDTIGGDWDYNDMVIKGTDLAPTPEPATVLLLGFGLIGAASLRKRFGK